MIKKNPKKLKRGICVSKKTQGQWDHTPGLTRPWYRTTNLGAQCKWLCLTRNTYEIPLHGILTSSSGIYLLKWSKKLGVTKTATYIWTQLSLLLQRATQPRKFRAVGKQVFGWLVVNETSKFKNKSKLAKKQGLHRTKGRENRTIPKIS